MATLQDVLLSKMLFLINQSLLLLMLQTLDHTIMVFLAIVEQALVWQDYL